jgi:preprotein translocase subunit SecA
VAAITAAALTKRFDVVNVATANDYLVERDSKFVLPFFLKLGITVSSGIESPTQVHYATMHKLCLSWLNDHLVCDVGNITHQFLHNKLVKSAIIIDEIDATLIESSTTPYSVNGALKQNEDRVNFCFKVAQAISASTPEILVKVDDSFKFSDEYFKEVERHIGGGGVELTSTHADLVYSIKSCIYAILALKNGEDYVVKGDIIYKFDKRSGRIFANTFQDSILNALQVKEGVCITARSAALVISTIPNYVKRYDMIVGMSGSAIANENELSHIYGLDVFEVDTNLDRQTKDLGYRLFPSVDAKISSAVEFIRSKHDTGAPVLVACSSDLEVERVRRELSKVGVKAQYLTSHNMDEEFIVFERAGVVGTVTVTTRVCGRGTDILIGDNVESLGGLVVVAMSAGETTVDDTQLLGRTGRQGRRGMFLAFTSLEDDIFEKNALAQRSMKRFFYEDDIDPDVTHYLKKTIYHLQLAKQSGFKNQRNQLMLFDKPMATHLDILLAKRVDVLSRSDFTSSAVGILKGAIDVDDAKASIGVDKFNSICKNVFLSSMDFLWKSHSMSVVNAREETMSNLGSGLFKYQERCQSLLSDFSIELPKVIQKELHHQLEKEVNFMNVASKFLSETDMKSLGSFSY